MGKKATEQTKGEKPEKKEKAPKLEFPEEPSKPDQDAFQKAKAEHETEIEKLRGGLDDFTKQIQGKQEGKEEYEQQKAALQLDFEKAKEYFEDLRSQHQDVIGKLKQQNQTKRDNAAELRDLKKNLDNMGEEGIDRRIKELEFKMHTQTMPLKEEKQIIKEIQELKRKRPEMQKQAQKLEQLEQSKELSELSKKPLEEQLTEIKEKIDHARTVKDEKSAVLKELRDSRAGQRSAIKELIEEKEKIKAKINERRDAIRELREGHRNEERAHQKWLYQCRDIRRQAKDAQIQKEWEQWEQEQKKEELTKAEEKPYFEEMTLLEQTIQYCNGLVKSDKKDEEEKKEVAFDAPEGCMVMVSKKERGEEMWHAGKKGKNLKKKSESKKQNNAIKHNAGTFSLFQQLKVNAPMTLDDVPETITQLEAKMEVYNEKIRDWQANKDKLKAEIEAAEAKEGATEE